MNTTALFATGRRVLTQLRHDPRSMVLMVVVPSLLLVLLRFVFDSSAQFDEVAPALLGFFPFLMMFLVTSITMLRERRSGTLERILTTPAGRIDVIGGYGVAFSALAVLQVAVAVPISLWLGLSVSQPLVWLFVVALLNALLGVALGLLASVFASSEFQAMQFVPLVVVPQLLLCGLFRARDQMADVLRWVSDVLPLSYAVQALQQVTEGDRLTSTYWRDTALLLALVVLAMLLAAGTLRRRTS